MMEYINHDWIGFIRNMRFGWFRNSSKFASDYIKALETKKTIQTFWEGKNLCQKFSYEGKFVLDKEHEKLIKNSLQV